MTAAEMLELAERLESHAECEDDVHVKPADLRAAARIVRMASSCTEFQIGALASRPHPANVVRVCRCEGYKLPIQPYMWAVRCCGNVLHKDGEWECEPQPSSRDEAFYASARFATYEEAETAALKAIEAAPC